MAINTEQQKRGLEQLRNIRRKYFSSSSEAADWWDKLKTGMINSNAVVYSVVMGADVVACPGWSRSHSRNL